MNGIHSASQISPATGSTTPRNQRRIVKLWQAIRAQNILDAMMALGATTRAPSELLRAATLPRHE